MLITIHPKLPMRNKSITKDYYINKLDFQKIGTAEYDDYLMLQKDEVEIHFFSYPTLNPLENYGQIYIRTNTINELYQSFLKNNVAIHTNGTLQTKPWGQREFSLLDPDNNLITFGQDAT